MPRRKLGLDEKTRNRELTGKVYLVTGANSGVGLETTRHLVSQGGHVVLACRRVEAAEKIARDFSELKGTYEIVKLDLSSLQSVRDCTEKLKKTLTRLDGLVCNAGMVDMKNEHVLTGDGLEQTMQINYFGHVLLTEGLLDLLKSDAPSRIVLLSSVAHAGSRDKRPDIHVEDMNFTSRPYNNFAAYREAKLASVLYARELSQRLSGSGVSAFSVHPGWARSNFDSQARGMMKFLLTVLRPFIKHMTDSNLESAQTSLHCLLSDDALNYNGAYFSQSSVLYSKNEGREGGWPLESPNPNANDDEKAARLVEETREILDLN